MLKPFALTGASIASGDTALTQHAVLVVDDHVNDIVPENEIPDKFAQISLSGGTLIPGLVDLQVNGGGGVLFNNDPSLPGIEAICAAHRKLGTCRLLVTLISSTPDITDAAIQAGIQATKKQVPGFLGLHLEGPHLAAEKRGAHSEHVLRPMEQSDVAKLCDAKKQLPYLLVTLAPEMVETHHIEQLTSAGIVVSLGHSNCDYSEAIRAFDYGASCTTHLFNAMSPLRHREPGLVGATLTHPQAFSGLIADGVHVHAAAIKTALNAKSGNGKIFIVSDAMATAGSTLKQFELDGRTIVRGAGRLELNDGTLAGADTDMLNSIRFLISEVGIDKAEAIKMASTYPSNCLGTGSSFGVIKPGHLANFLHVDEQLGLKQAWVDGVTQLEVN